MGCWPRKSVCLHAQISLRYSKPPCLCSPQGWLADGVLVKFVLGFSLSNPCCSEHISNAGFKQDSQFRVPSQHVQPPLACSFRLGDCGGLLADGPRQLCRFEVWRSVAPSCCIGEVWQQLPKHHLSHQVKVTLK